jgi:phage shock protein A
MAVESLVDGKEASGPELKICKLASPCSSLNDDRYSVTIDLKEKANFALTFNLSRIDQRIEKFALAIEQTDKETRQALQSKNRSLATTQLMRKKQYEKQLENLYGQKLTMEQQMLTLEATENTSTIFETLSVASTATKQQQQAFGDDSSMDDIINDMAEAKEELERVNQLFINEAVSTQDDQELLRELEKLSLEEKPVPTDSKEPTREEKE